MIITEKLDNGLIHTYSDRNMMISQENGDMYIEALDVLEHTYKETDVPIDYFLENKSL